MMVYKSESHEGAQQQGRVREKQAPAKRAGPAPVVQIIVLMLLVLVTIWLIEIRDQLAQYGHLGYTGIFLFTLASNATLFFPIPGPLAALAGGSLFDPILVSLVAATGATLGEITGYVAGVSGKHLIQPRPRLARVKAWMERYGLVPVIVLAAIPNPFFDCAGILAGALRIPVAHFLLATWAGKLAKFLVFAYLGANLASHLSL